MRYALGNKVSHSYFQKLRTSGYTINSETNKGSYIADDMPITGGVVLKNNKQAIAISHNGFR